MLKRMRRSLRTRLVRVIDDVIRQHRHELGEALRQERGQLEEVIRLEVGRTLAAISQVELRDRRDLAAAGERDAVRSSVQFATDRMPTARTFPHPHRTLEYALSLAPPVGMALEFGVFSGQTLRIIAAACNGKQVYGFDSFAGLPEDWRSNFHAGTFDVDEIPDVVGAELVVGWFHETLPAFLAEHPEDVAFLHLDADLYSSTKTVLDLIGPRLRTGSIIVFDEYFNYPGWQQHEHRAWQEYTERTGTRFSYEGYTVDNEQVIVRILDS